MWRRKIDTTKTVEIRKSSLSYLITVLIGGILTAVLLWSGRAIEAGTVTLPRRFRIAADGMIRDGWINSHADFVWIPIGFVIVVVLMVLLVLAFTPRVAIRLTPNGFTDLRASKQEIPWQDIRGLDSTSYYGFRYTLLELSPTQIKDLRLGWYARFNQNSVSKGNPRGLYVNALELRTTPRSLEKKIRAYFETHQTAGLPG